MRVVEHDEWLAERTELLAKEKELSRLRDDLARQRRELPWERVDKDYIFTGADGQRTLSDLFDGRSQLVVYHFMFEPAWDAGCKSCSFWADNFDPNVVHLRARDVALVAVSIAPYAKLAAYRGRMGWSFPWYSSAGSEFNADYGVSFTDEAPYNYGSQTVSNMEREGVSVFAQDPAGAVFHTYSTYARGIDLLNTAYNYLDLVPKGRDEDGRPQSWVRRHDEYDVA
jgi:predicted dithiol-disulfide oxidoreductase (DUF899 family)